MARKASIEKNNRRKKLSAKYYKLRASLKEKLSDMSVSDEEKDLARKKLQSLPNNSSPHRVRNRCEVTGRPRGNYRKFGLCRLTFRQMALLGKLPGVTKASW